ncbi:MAG TPA: hypothetical protein VFO39_10850 [Candidatus Sulfotelmatobacter sp.]|nr:hypothetical protein [Candidatus Sulfotelmatobacter sp.]
MASATSITAAPKATGLGDSLREWAPQLVVAAALLFWGFQIAWFWRYCGHNINSDAVSYIGIARHILDGDFRASLHGYWSPLVSWLIAALSPFSKNLMLDARLLMFPAFAACLFLTYRLTYKLWGSRLLAALALLWFAAARGLAAFTVFFIGADLILTAFTLLYFTLLLACIEKPNDNANWIWLGVVHSFAFLAKAIAMPLFAVSTLVVAAWTLSRKATRALRALLLAAIFPALVWFGWGMALRAKYGVFTTGYQLHWNLLDPASRAAEAHRLYGMLALREERETLDSYMVTDSMPPASPFWKMSIRQNHLLRRIARSEMQNIPKACKELLVLLTPGGLLALLLCLVGLTRKRLQLPAQFRFACVVLLTSATLIAAYSMLVLDTRYVIPIAPAWMALAIRFAVPPAWSHAAEPQSKAKSLQAIAAVLLAIGMVTVQVYWASPFRTIGQDFQTSVYQTAEILKQAHARTLVNIGLGPYPEHGVGWEAGYYTGFFGNLRVIGGLQEIPSSINPSSVAADLAKLRADAVVVWGAPSDSTCGEIVSRIHTDYPNNPPIAINDPKKGQVATLFLLNGKSS